MPICGHFTSGSHAHAGREPAIEGPGPAVGRDRASTIEVHHLACRMDAGIGATGRHSPDWTVRVEGCNRTLQGLLHAGEIALPLPTMERLTVVLNAEG